MVTRGKKVSRQAETQEALRKSEKRFRALLEHSYDAVVLTTAEGKTIYASPAIKRVIGYTPEEYMQLNGIELMHADDLEDGITFFRHILQKPGVTFPPHQTRFKQKDGSWRWIEYTATNLIHDPDVGAIVFNFRDITEQKKAEIERTRADEALQKHLSLVNGIIEQTEDIIFVKDTTGRYILVNPQTEALFQKPKQEILGKTARELFPREIAQNLEEVDQRIMQAKKAEVVEEHVTTANGEIRTYLSTKGVYFDAKGNVIGLIGISRDITERKKREEQQALLNRQVKEAREQLEIILQNAADGIIVYNQHGQIIYANDAAAHMTGFSSVQAMLKTLRTAIVAQFEIIDEQGHPFPLSQLPHQRVLAGEQEAQAIIGYRPTSTNQSERWSLSKARPVYDEQGKLLFAITIIHDITERVRAERRKDEFISMASHELKTPVTSLKGFTNVLQRRLAKQGDEQGLTYLAIMDRQLNKLTQLISDLLDVSKIQTGKLDYREEPFDLAALVRETLENVQAATQTHRLLLEDTAQAQVFGDRDRIGQVLINLLTNAMKYSPQADKVLVCVWKDEENAYVSVQDFGIGIAKEHQQKIFGRFYQVTDLGEKTFPGLGIGLYISHEIITRHHGRIWVESSKGTGATFYVSLPLTL